MTVLKNEDYTLNSVGLKTPLIGCVVKKTSSAVYCFLEERLFKKEGVIYSLWIIEKHFVEHKSFFYEVWLLDSRERKHRGKNNPFCIKFPVVEGYGSTWWDFYTYKQAKRKVLFLIKKSNDLGVY